MVRRAALLAGLVLAPLVLGGCVERILAVRSEPAGAAVYVDGEPAGVTPLEFRYLWYGTRELLVELPGHRLVRELVTLNPPWWQILPLDFVTDVLVPFTLTDRVDLHYRLDPAPVSREEVQEVLRRAEELRGRASSP
jgi:hypothetical protein